MFHSDPRLADTVFVVFSDDWGRHPSSCQHLFRRVLPHARVLWVNTIGLRTPRIGLYDAKRALQVAAAWIRPAARKGKAPSEGGTEAPAPEILRPLMWPSFRNAWSAGLNQKLLARTVNKALAGVPAGKNIVLVSSLPIVPEVFRSNAFRRKVYYCVDDFTQWHGIDGKAMRKLEAQTLARCDALVATSSAILESRGKSLPGSARATLLTHGVDAEHFASGRARADGQWARYRRPVLGMFGVFDRRIDVELLRDLSRAFPDGSLLAVGPVDRDQKEFADIPNLFLPGKIGYTDLPDCVAAFDVCLLPYVVDESTRSINPLKLKEYLATGKPVVATPLPEAEKLKGFLTIADRSQFPRAVAEALRNAHATPAGLDDFLRSESWDRKAERFFDFVLEGL